MTLAEALAAVHADLRMVMAPDAETSLQSLLAAASPADLQRCAFLVGPEGGLDSGEILTAQESGFAPCRMGPRVLRTESAALAILAALQFSNGDLGAAPDPAQR